MNTLFTHSFGIVGIVCHVLLIVFTFVMKDVEFYPVHSFKYGGYRTKLSEFSPTTWSWCNRAVFKSVLVSCLVSLPIHVAFYILTAVYGWSFVIVLATMLLPTVSILLSCPIVEIVGRRKFRVELLGI